MACASPRLASVTAGFAERLRVIVVQRLGRPDQIGLRTGLGVPMIASSVCTARAANAPTAVSPDSMIPSTPSSTALAASLTSARVGRDPVVIDSSTCVATMTGMPLPARPVRDVLLRPRHALERHLEAEIAAGDHHAVTRRENLVEVLQGLRPFELGDERHVGLPLLGHQLAGLLQVGRRSARS